MDKRWQQRVNVFFFIKNTDNVFTEYTFSYILKTFEQVTEQCLKEDQQYSSLKNGITEPSEIDYCDIIKKMTLAETEPHKIESPGKPSLQDENRKRLLNLIFRSTTSNNL